MKIFFETKGKYIILLVVVCQLLNTSCSRHFFPGKSLQNIQRGNDKRKLKNFMQGGTEKRINTHHATVNEVIRTAQEHIGVPHCPGGTTVKCMDCSGLLVTVFGKHGIYLPHNSEEQARYGKIITGMDELIKGDLVFFFKSYKTNRFITHSGIYIGNNKFIHSSSQKGVTITSLYNPWWKEKFIFGTRVFEKSNNFIGSQSVFLRNKFILFN